MKLIVGLGNPGEKYEKTRHNCGFRVIEKLEEALGISCNKIKFQGLYGKGKYRGEDIVLLKPTTYMNASGISISEAAHFFKVDVNDIIVIYDDLDTEVGKIRLRETGNPGGHNGMKDVVAHLNTKNFKRVRVGIGRDMKIKIIDYVLMRIPKEQESSMEEAFNMAKDAVMLTLEKGFNHAMNKYN